MTRGYLCEVLFGGRPASRDELVVAVKELGIERRQLLGFVARELRG